MARGAIRGITIEIGADATPFNKAFRDIDSTVKRTASSLRDINKLLKMDPGNTTLLKQKQEELKKAIEQTKDKIKLEKDALEQLKKADQTPAVIEQQKALQREIIEDENRLKSLQNEFRSFGSVAKQQMIAVGEKVKEVGANISAFGDKISGAGKEMSAKVTAPIVAIGAASVKAFDTVDQGMDTIIAKTGATGAAAEEMGDILENIATSIPTDFQTAGAAIGEVNTRFGLTGDALQDLSEDFVKFATLNKTDVSNSIDQVQKIMAAYGVETQDASKVLDLLNATGQKTGISMDKLNSTLVTNGSQMRELGFGVAESAEFLGKLETSGIDASSVMTGLKRAMANAAQDGVGFGDAMRALQDDMMNATSNTEAMEKAIDLFGTRAGPQFAEAIRSGVISMDDLLKSTETLESNIGNLDKTFDATQDVTDRFKTAMNGVTVAGKELGQVILGVVAPYIEKASAKVKELTGWFKGLSDGQKELIVKIAAVAAAIGPVLVVVGTLISAIGKVVTGVGAVIQVLGALATPVGVIVAAVGALTAAFLYFYNTNEEFRAKVQEIWAGIQDQISVVIEAIKGILQSFAELATAIWERWGNNIMAVVTTVFEAVKGIINGALTFIQGIINTIMAVIRGDWQAAWEGIKQILSGALEVFYNLVVLKLTAIWAFIGSILGVIKAVFETIWNAIKAVVQSAMDAIRSVITTAWDTIKVTVTTAMNAIKAVVTSVWNAIKAAVQTAIDGVKNVIDSGLTSAKVTATNLLNSVKSLFTDTFNNIKSHVSGVVEWLKGCFKFEWSLPKIKLPHFSISGGFSLDPPSVPHFSIDWYKKAYDNAMLFKSPTVLATAAGLKGFGDGRGAEMVIGQNNLMNSISRASGAAEMVARLDIVTGLLMEYLPEVAASNVYLDKDVLVGQITPAVNRQLGLAYRG